MSTIPVPILRLEDRTVVEAALHTELPPSVLIETEEQWGPIRWDAAQRLFVTGRTLEIPQHWRWDWNRKKFKLDWLAYQCLGIEYDGKFQGLVLVKTAGVNARLEPDEGKPLVYIDYLESAPWNSRVMVDTPLYGGVGSVLMQAAVQLSYDEGFHGRIGLHALPQSEGFYREACGMQYCGSDASYENLAYYEMTREGARRFSTSAQKGTE